MRTLLPALAMTVACAVTSMADGSESSTPLAPTVADLVKQLNRDANWRLVESIPVGFRTHHPQGMVRIGDAFFVSSVEVTTPPSRFPQVTTDGYDRSPGTGVGHLFKIDRQGRLLGSLTLGEGAVYHPGGIDFDGRDLWVPVAEYRPNSHSILYRVDPTTMNANEVLRVADHVGALVHNTDDRTLHGVSWGSRRFYRWTLDADGRVTNGSAPLDQVGIPNASHYVDYQDCKYAGDRQMLCAGVVDLRPSPTAPIFRLGGLDLISLADSRPVHQTPLLLWTPGGRPMTQNPAWFETTATTLRGYFMPDDDASTIYVYDLDGM